MPDYAAPRPPLSNRPYTLHGGLVAGHAPLPSLPRWSRASCPNYRLYQVWAIGPRLILPGKQVFSGLDHVNLLENLRWVLVLADLLPRQAWTRLIPYILLFAILVGYDKGLHSLSKSLCRCYDQENHVRQSRAFSCPLSTYPIWPRESGLPRIEISISGRSVTPISYWKKVVQLGCTNLLSVGGAHKSVLF